MTAKTTIRQLLKDARLDEAIDEFNRRYLPSTRLISHMQREEAKRCLTDLLAEEPVSTPLCSPLVVSVGSPATDSKSDECDNPSQVKKLQDKIKKLETRKEEIRTFGMKCFNEAEELKRRLSFLEEERDKLINDNKTLETECDKYFQQARYYQSNSQILENKCKMLQREFEQAKERMKTNSYGSQLGSQSDQSDQYEDDDLNEDSHLSPDVIGDSMEDSESDSNIYCGQSNNNMCLPSSNAKSRYPTIEPDLVPHSQQHRSRHSVPIRDPSRFPEQPRVSHKPVRQAKQKSATTNNVTRERSSTTINDLVLAKYLSEKETVRAFSGKTGSFYGTIVLSDKQQYGILDEQSSDGIVYTNPSSWVKRDIVLQQVQKSTSIVRKSQYSGWENVKVLRTCPKTNTQKWTKLAIVRKMYDSAIEASSLQQPTQNYTFTQAGGYTMYSSAY